MYVETNWNENECNEIKISLLLFVNNKCLVYLA